MTGPLEQDLLPGLTPVPDGVAPVVTDRLALDALRRAAVEVAIPAYWQTNIQRALAARGENPRVVAAIQQASGLGVRALADYRRRMFELHLTEAQCQAMGLTLKEPQPWIRATRNEETRP